MSSQSLNDKLAKISFRDEVGDWYSLDNAALIMPSVADDVSTYLFRFSATIVEAIHLPSLQTALENTGKRFPYFCVHLKRGFFWYYMVPHAAAPKLVADQDSPCLDFNMHSGSILFRVRARENTIACEFSHILTDGTGGLRFFKNLLVEYFRLRGIASDISADPDLYDLNAAPEHGEREDAYNRYFPGKYPYPAPERPAFRIKSALLPPGCYRVIRGSIPLAPAKAVAKKYGVSLTELLSAAYIEALQEVWLASKQRQRRLRSRLAIEVPVNMRKFLDTKTNRNFSLFVHVEQDMRLGSRAFEDILLRVHHYLHYEVDGPSMARQIARNVMGGRMLLIRLIPLALKAPLMRFLYSYYGANKISGVLSNLGPVSLPGAIADRVRNIDFILGPSTTCTVHASCLSWGGVLCVNFGSLVVSRETERLFFTRLRKLGLPVKVECNLEE